MGQILSSLLCRRPQLSVSDLEGFNNDFHFVQCDCCISRYQNRISDPRSIAQILNHPGIDKNAIEQEKHEQTILESQQQLLNSANYNPIDIIESYKDITPDILAKSPSLSFKLNNDAQNGPNCRFKPIIHVWKTGPLSCNTILLIDPITRDGIIIDPGGETFYDYHGTNANYYQNVPLEETFVKPDQNDPPNEPLHDNQSKIGQNNDIEPPTPSNDNETEEKSAKQPHRSRKQRRAAIKTGEKVEIIPLIKRFNVNITMIVVTHGHFDHFLGIGHFRKAFPEAKIWLHHKDKIIWQFLSLQLRMFPQIRLTRGDYDLIGKPDGYFMNLESEITTKQQDLNEATVTSEALGSPVQPITTPEPLISSSPNEEKPPIVESQPTSSKPTIIPPLTKHSLTLTPITGNLTFKNIAKLDFLDGIVLHTPGHSEGSICLYFPSSNLLISGDTLLNQQVGRSDFNGGSKRDIFRSILLLLYKLPNCTCVIPGHGPMTLIGREKMNNNTVRFGDAPPR